MFPEKLTKNSRIYKTQGKILKTLKFREIYYPYVARNVLMTSLVYIYFRKFFGPNAENCKNLKIPVTTISTGALSSSLKNP